MVDLRRIPLLSDICFALNCLLLFLALFGSNMEVPVFLQVAGRAHPLLLHFPIVLILLSFIWETLIQTKKQPVLQNIGDDLLLTSSLTAVVAALMGLFLSKEGGYEDDALFWHQWSGVAVSGFAWAWYGYRRFLRQNWYASRLAAALFFIVLIIAGHKGATLTHGENYLFAPLMPEIENPSVSLEDALLFEHVIRPILKEKCMNCHNSGKLKGGLNMESEETLLKGGKHGMLWDTTADDLGLMLRRIHLPLEEKEHMPPKGKLQLTEEEIGILRQWIKTGANFSQKIVDLPENDTLRLFATQRILSAPKAVRLSYHFEAADETVLKKLNNDYRVVRPLALNSPALSVAFYGRTAFKKEDLKELDLVKEQVVYLNLENMPVNDEDLQSIGIFSNLAKLNLAFTKITGATLAELTLLKSLESLSLSGTSVGSSNLEALTGLPKLEVIYLWNTAVSKQDLPGLQQRFPKLRFELGFKGDGVTAKLNAPIIEDESQVFSGFTKVNLKNFIRGAELRYTLDGTVPDSLNSAVFTGDSLTIEKSCQLNAKAFLKGWIASEVATRNYYKIGILPDSIVLRYPPNPQYKGEGAKTLANKKIGDTDFRSNKWLGYKETNLEALFLFHHPVTLSSVSLSTLVDIGSYIMPAAEIQIWGGASEKQLTLLKKLNPTQPDKAGAPGYRIGYTCGFNPRNLSVIKIVAKPVVKLPSWHPGKGERGWVFVDEVFFE